MRFDGHVAILSGAASGIGLLRARMLAAESGRLGLTQSLALVVDLILYLCSDKAAFITGANYLIDGGRTCGAMD